MLKEAIIVIGTCWGLLLAAALLAWIEPEVWWWTQFTWYHLGWILGIAGIIQLVRWWQRVRFRRRLKITPADRPNVSLPTVGTKSGTSYLIEALPKWRGFWIQAGGQSFWLKRGKTVVATVVHEKNKAGQDVVRYDFDQTPEALLRHRQQRIRGNAG